ncbi:MAG: AMP-binding protein [Clostridiales bacterium]|nr:AMP-binding protein [Clostridiales bacterium]
MDKLWEITLGDLLDYQAERFPDQDCVVYNDRPFRTTYREFRDLVNLTAKGLMRLGVGKGDHVSMWGTNVPEWQLALWAAAKIGAVLVTVNTAYKVFEAEYLLRQSDTHTLVMTEGYKDSDYVSIMNDLVPELEGAEPGCWESDGLPRLKNIVICGGGRHDGMLNWESLAELGREVGDEALEAAQRACSFGDVVNMQYTSGTTGFPKGVMLTHLNIVNNGLTIGDCMKFSPADRLCLTVPLFHCFGLVLATMASITHAGALCMVEAFSPAAVLKTIHEEKCTAFHGVPTMFIAMMEHPDFPATDFSHMRTGIMAGSPCPVKVMRQVVERMNMPEITIVYGLTEASPGCTQTTTDDSLELRVSTVGRNLPFIETKVVDPETGEICPPGVPGEFMARGYNIMKGYYKMPEATAAAITPDGWLHSGDLATVDEKGYYKITGRIKDMIIRGGENIYPKEIEECLYTHPDVQDVQVIGVPSEAYGEEVMAYIIRKPGADLSEDEAREYLRQRIARHKVPKYVAYIEEFPMTASGKIQKFKLRDMAVRDLKLQDAANVETA